MRSVFMRCSSSDSVLERSQYWAQLGLVRVLVWAGTSADMMLTVEGVAGRWTGAPGVKSNGEPRRALRRGWRRRGRIVGGFVIVERRMDADVSETGGALDPLVVLGRSFMAGC